MLETHIARARKLKIHFYGEQACDSGPQIQVFSFLASHSSQWVELSVALTSELVPLLGDLQDRIPSLCRLSIQWSDETSLANIDSIGCFHRAPCLVDVTLFNEYRPVPVSLPLHQLTAFRADNSWEFHRGVLGIGLNLVELRITIDFDEDMWPRAEGTIHLPCLRRLFVSIYEILHFLVTPALDDLAIDFWIGGDIPKTFESFVERSGCTLRRLCVYGRFDAATLAVMLKGRTTITELDILNLSTPRDQDDIPALLAMLTLTPATPHVAPHLQSISLGFEEGSRVDHTGSLFLEMIHSRWKQPHRALRAAALLSSEPLGPIDDLNMRQEGLDLLVLDGPSAEQIMSDWTYQESWS